MRNPNDPMSDELTEQDLSTIEERCNKAARQPWKSYIEGRDHQSGSSFIRTGEPADVPGTDIELSGATDADQDFIAHARQDVPRLIAEVRRLRALLRPAG